MNVYLYRTLDSEINKIRIGIVISETNNADSLFWALDENGLNPNQVELSRYIGLGMAIDWLANQVGEIEGEPDYELIDRDISGELLVNLSLSVSSKTNFNGCGWFKPIFSNNKITGEYVITRKEFCK